jgi:hypothetical protein
MYRLFRNPRYAYREMLYLGIIQGRSYSGMKVTGVDFLRIIDRVLDFSNEEILTGGFN